MTATELSRRLWSRVRGPERSATRRLLVSLCVALLTLSVLVFLTCLLVFARMYDTSSAVQTGTVPAMGEIAAAKSALLRADRAAIVSFTTGGAQLAGPGDEFQNQIAVASQSLTRVAEHNMAGDLGSGVLQLVEGLMVSYVSMIGQADAHFRQPDGETLGAVDLWNASRLLHKPDGALVNQLDTLLAAHQRVLDGQLADTATTPGAVVVVLLPAVALLVLLVITNLVFFRRFRRRMNLWLALAVAALVSLTVITGQVAGTDQELDITREMVNDVLTEQRALDEATDLDGQRRLRDLVVDEVCAVSDGCGATLTRFENTVDTMRVARTGTDEGELAEATREVTEQAVAATVDTVLRTWSSVLAVLLVGTVWLGFRPRLNEYRFRPR